MNVLLAVGAGQVCPDQSALEIRIFCDIFLCVRNDLLEAFWRVLVKRIEKQVLVDSPYLLLWGIDRDRHHGLLVLVCSFAVGASLGQYLSSFRPLGNTIVGIVEGASKEQTGQKIS